MLRSREEIESILQEDLNAVEECLRRATPDRLREARERFKDALHRFTVFVMYGQVPKELRYESRLPKVG
jgi:hypothetical protein